MLYEVITLRLLVARDQVNQGAAAVLMSVEAARRLGVPPEKWVYLRGHADLIDQSLLDRDRNNFV